MRYIAALVVVSLVFAAGCVTQYTSLSQSKESAVVARVVDGDTLELENGDRVRILGINSPEKNNFYYQEAKDRMVELVEGKQITMEKGDDDKDRYGRLLRFVFVGDEFVNLQMVKEGYASVYLMPQGSKYYDEFSDAELGAKKNKVGIWSSAERSCIEVIFMNYNAEGNDNENLNDEYATFRNVCDEAVELRGWTVKDEGRNTYTLGSFVLDKESEFTLHSGKGTDNSSDLYWNSRMGVWNNDGDTLFLRDGQGNLVLSYKYP